jgi:hypothetical protein
MWYDEEDIARLVGAYRPFFRWPIRGPVYARTGEKETMEIGVVPVQTGKRKKITEIPVPVVLQSGGKWVKVNPPISPRRLREAAKGLGLTDKEVAEHKATTDPFRHPAIKAYFDLVESERRCLYAFYRRLREIPADELWNALVGVPPDPERVDLLKKRMRACRERKERLSLSIDTIAKITAVCISPFKPMEWKNLSRKFRSWKTKEEKRASVRRRQT